jgi:hypothetical protein
MARTAAFRSIAGNINEFAPLAAFRADIRWPRDGDGITALVAFPISQVTLGAYISNEPAVCRIATVCANILFCFIFHVFLLLSISS